MTNDEASLGQEDHRRCQLLDRAVATHRCVLDPVLAEARLVDRGHVGLDVAGRQRVDPHPELAPLRGQAAGEVVHGGLGRVVGGLPLGPVDDEARHGPDVDDRARALLHEVHGRSVWLHVHTASRLTLITWRQSSGVTSRAGAWTQAPALLTRMSHLPKRSRVTLERPGSRRRAG